MNLIQSVAPSSQPVTLEEAKDFLRILDTDDDVLIGSMILQATQSAEIIMNRQIMPATYELYLNAMHSEIILPRPPFISLESFQAFDGTVWNDVSEYDLDDKAMLAALYPSFTGVVSSKKNSVKVVYKAGYAAADKVPESIKTWIKIQVSSYYENREPFVVGVSVSELPYSHVNALLNRYKVHNV